MATFLEKLKLNELSLVDKGANQHARVSIFKRHDPLTETIQKYYGELVKDRDAIKDFSELLRLRDKESKLWKAREELWPVLDAFRETVNNIVVDVNLSLDAKMAQIESNVNSFVAAVREKVPDVEEELTKFFKDAGFSGNHPTDITENEPVSDTEKKIEGLTKALETAQAEVAVAKAIAGFTDVEKAHYEGLDEKAKSEFIAKSADDRKAIVEKIAKADESVELNGQSIKKSAVAPEVFAILKSQSEEIAKSAERIAKAEEAAEMATLRKRADDEFGKVVGTADEKALLLKALAKAGGDVEAYGLKVLKSAEAGEAFVTKGVSHAKVADVKKALDDKVSEIAKRDNIPTHQAMAKVAVEFPDLVNQE